jgi:hypothetical protein
MAANLRSPLRVQITITRRKAAVFAARRGRERERPYRQASSGSKKGMGSEEEGGQS